MFKKIITSIENQQKDRVFAFKTTFMEMQYYAMISFINENRKIKKKQNSNINKNITGSRWRFTRLCFEVPPWSQHPVLGKWSYNFINFSRDQSEVTWL